MAILESGQLDSGQRGWSRLSSILVQGGSRQSFALGEEQGLDSKRAVSTHPKQARIPSFAIPNLLERIGSTRFFSTAQEAVHNDALD